MPQIEAWLGGGDLRSDGASNQVAEFVIAQPDLIPDLIATLASDDPVVRGRAADAIEKAARVVPASFAAHFPALAKALDADPVPMVRWHLSMVLGHLSMVERLVDQIEGLLLRRLSDESVFGVSWAIASLCLVAFQYPEKASNIVKALAPLRNSRSTALRTRATKALAALSAAEGKLPAGWVKSEHIAEVLRKLD